MKKLKLSALNVENHEVLTREHLKSVLGGVTSFSEGCYLKCGDSTEEKLVGDCERSTFERECDDTYGTCSCF